MAEAATYPKRESHYAHRFCRTMTKAAAAMELGTDVCWFLTVIAHQEDVKRYKPVNYWNEQLMALVGVKSVDKLIRMRNAAVAAGWLHYHSGGKYRPGVYWVLIPAAFEDMADTACDEPDSSICTQKGSAANRDQIETKPAAKRTQTGRESSNPKPSPLTPDPKEDCSEPPTATAEPPVYPVFPCSGRKTEPKRWEATDTILAELADAFPGVGVRAEARKAWQWVIGKPGNRKTARGMPDFLFRWMARVQDKGGGAPRAGPRTAADRTEEANNAFREAQEDCDALAGRHSANVATTARLAGPAG